MNTQVVICNSAQERTECLKRLKEMGWKAYDKNDSFETAPYIKLLHYDLKWQTVIETSLSDYHEQISASQFLSDSLTEKK